MNEYCILLLRYISTLPKIFTTVTQIKTFLQGLCLHTHKLYTYYSYLRKFHKIIPLRFKLYLDLT